MKRFKNAKITKVTMLTFGDKRYRPWHWGFKGETIQVREISKNSAYYEVRTMSTTGNTILKTDVTLI
jgi:hypothetical protein